MVIEGWIDERNLPWVNITVQGLQKEETIAVIVDTGFTGELWLPLNIAVPLGLGLAGVGRSSLADGGNSKHMLFTGSLSWGTARKPVTIIVTDADAPLLGGGLLRGYTLTADFEKRTLLIKEPGVDEPQANDTEI